MKPEDVPDAWFDAALDAYWDSAGGTHEGVRAALAAVIPLVREEEREAVLALLSDEGWAKPMDASGIDAFTRLAAAIRARNTP